MAADSANLSHNLTLCWIYMYYVSLPVVTKMSKPNVSEGFRQKVKQFFGAKKGHVIPSSVYEGPKPDEFFFHQELLQVDGPMVLEIVLLVSCL